MCVSAGAPKKPRYGACNERHLAVTNYWANVRFQYYYSTTTSTAGCDLGTANDMGTSATSYFAIP